MVSSLSRVGLSPSSVISTAPTAKPAAIYFGSNPTPPTDPEPTGRQKTGWKSFGKDLFRSLFMYDLPSKPAIDELAKAHPDNAKAQTLKKHARWAENGLRVLNWANWAMIFTLPVPVLHFVTGPVLLGTAIVEIGARIGLESHMRKRVTNLYNELNKPQSA